MAAAVAFPGKQRRWTFFAKQQLLGFRVPGDSFESLVLVGRRSKVELREIGDIQRGGLCCQRDDGDHVSALINDCQFAAIEHRDPFGIAPADQRYLAQYITLTGQLDQEGIVPHDCKQRFALWVIGKVRSLVVFHAGQYFGINIHTVVRQPDTGLALRDAGESLLDPEQAAVVPMHGERNAIRHRCHR
ncbi:hypothetical protein D3C81_1473720 [compost metagenome]